jgi:hypothetical protein
MQMAGLWLNLAQAASDRMFCREPDGTTTEQAPQTSATAQLRTHNSYPEARRTLDRPQRLRCRGDKGLPMPWLQC